MTKWDKSGLKEACQRGLALGRTRQEFDIQLLLDMLLEIERLERLALNAPDVARLAIEWVRNLSARPSERPSNLGESFSAFLSAVEALDEPAADGGFTERDNTVITQAILESQSERRVDEALEGLEAKGFFQGV